MNQIDHWRRAPKKKKQRSELFGIFLIVAVAIGIWLINGRDPGTPSSAVPISPESSASAPAPQSPQSPEVSGVDPDSGLPRISVDALPVEAIDVLTSIDRGGPFPYDKDGSRFGNFEGLLPDEPDGYYAEYTVDTPGASNRGARRIVTGDGGEYYWTADHYESFSRILR